jgi:cephalosporin hydroxylase
VVTPRGRRFAGRFTAQPDGQPVAGLATTVNPLEAYFDAHTEGPGIWKWRHYFDIYHRHLNKFVGTEAHIVEIGVYSGGSLQMWREYFGDRACIYGVDIEPACRAYDGEQVTIFIGDQGDPRFWESFRREVPHIDVVIDDGGHRPLHQIATLEGLLPFMRPGGVYICEDVLGEDQPFHSYVMGLASNLHVEDQLTPFQQRIDSVHLYPYLTVIELASQIPQEFVCQRHGTEWQPFYSFYEPVVRPDS